MRATDHHWRDRTGYGLWEPPCRRSLLSIGFNHISGCRKVARTTINRLSDRRVRTAPAGMHADGGGVYLRVTAGNDCALSRYWLFRYADRRTGKDRQLGIGPLDTVSLAAAPCGGP
jgi:hypothetical protein